MDFNTFKNNLAHLNKSNIELEILKFTLELYNNDLLSRKAVDFVIKRVKELFSDTILPHIENQINRKFNSAEDEEVFYKIKFILDCNKQHFDKFDTEYKRFQYYEQHCAYIAPEEYLLGETEIYVETEAHTKKEPKKKKSKRGVRIDSENS